MGELVVMLFTAGDTPTQPTSLVCWLFKTTVELLALTCE